jgi:hypothetical protein
MVDENVKNQRNPLKTLSLFGLPVQVALAEHFEPLA